MVVYIHTVVMLFYYTSVDSYLGQSSDLKAVQKLENNFANLLHFAVNALKHAGVTDSDVHIFLNQISLSHKENIPLHDLRMSELITHQTLEEIFLFCSRIEVWDFLNFQLLMDLADHFRVKDLQAHLQKHITAVNIFKQDTKLIDFLRIWNFLNRLPNSDLVFAKLKEIKWDDYTLEDVARHEKFLMSGFRLKQLVMQFIAGSVRGKQVNVHKKPMFNGMAIEDLNIKPQKCLEHYNILSHHKCRHICAHILPNNSSLL